MNTINLESRADLVAFCEDVAKVALEWARVFENNEAISEVSHTNVRDLGREIADRLEARWLSK